ncbi:class I SAM-dependent methyltransferase [Paenibacillus tyrfis]|uniref:class I SAM-dependent methyltransferase n=1 Tax=Paenibacillus tyrfis TaxID=1501230 RepID=UPI0020A040B1|nr:class I SAM-dependent methyltransferase [Paenibacillus tyrfis]MCP1311215.1 class I SAM-dependent methyltransferase [Paenibacillus tyrfis]
MPNHDQIYAEQAGRYHRLISKQPELAHIVQSIKPFADLDIVDLGAGSGRLSSVLIGQARSLTATDASAAMLNVLKERIAETDRPRLRTVVADHRELPLPDASADLIVSGWSLGYLANSNDPIWLSNLERILLEINRVLRPGGTVIIFETMGTGFETPNPPDFLLNYYAALERQYGFTHQWIRSDYTFESLSEAEELTRFFFGDELASQVVANSWTTVPECAGIWFKHY